MGKYFYIDENGNKKKYVGNVTQNIDGTFTGVLTKTIYTDKVVKLHYAKSGNEILKSDVLYFYIDKNGKKQYVDLLDNNVKTENDSLFIEFVNKEKINLTYHPETEASVYYTYFNNKTKQHEVFTGEILHNESNNSYYGYK
jgi:hypothetical protein